MQHLGCISKTRNKNSTKLLFGLFSVIKISENREISRVKYSINSSKLINVLGLFGHTPIPPYICYIGSEKNLRSEYQTLYAKGKMQILFFRRLFNYSMTIFGWPIFSI